MFARNGSSAVCSSDLLRARTGATRPASGQDRVRAAAAPPRGIRPPGSAPAAGRQSGGTVGAVLWDEKAWKRQKGKVALPLVRMLRATAGWAQLGFALGAPAAGRYDPTPHATRIC